MEIRILVATLVNCVPLVSMQQTGVPSQCIIVQDRMSIFTPSTPDFLAAKNKTVCQVHGKEGLGLLRCGASDVYINPECVCSFHNVYEATMFHDYTSCPNGEGSDIVTKLKCPDCKKYSLNNNGPCINGGNLTCHGEELAPNINCQCPPHYKGMFCEEKIENITRICDRIDSSSVGTLTECTLTKKDCVTYSRNRTYTYRCNETEESQEGRGLPLCINTEDTVPYVLTESPYSNLLEDAKMGQSLNSAAVTHLTIPFITISLMVQM